MEARLRAKDRTVLEPVAELEPSTASGDLVSAAAAAAPFAIRSLSLFPPSPSESRTHAHLGSGGGEIALLDFDPSAQSAVLIRSASITSRPVESILPLPEIDRILALSGGSVFLLDRRLLHPARKLGFIKDATAAAKRLATGEDSWSLDSLNDGSGGGGSKTELLTPGKKLLQKLGGGIRPVNGTRPTVTETQRMVEGRGSSCFIAVAAAPRKLVLVELFSPLDANAEAENDAISVVFRDVQAVNDVKAMSWIGESIILGNSDGYSLFSASTGRISSIFSLPESSGHPKLRNLANSGEVLLLVDNVGVVVNSYGQPVGGSLVFQDVPECMAEISSFVIAVSDGRIDLYRKKTGLCVQSLSFAKAGIGFCISASEENANAEVVLVGMPSKVIFFRKVPADEQLKDLLRKKDLKEALSLVDELKAENELTKKSIAFVHAQLGFLLLFDLHFEDAVNNFLLSETMQPSEVFPFIMRDPNRWSHLVPRNRYWGLHPPPVPLEELVDEGWIEIQRATILRKAGVETSADQDFLLNLPSKAKLLESAIENIIRYLHFSRGKDLIPEVREGVDTLLMYLYRALNRMNDMEQLASSQNNCVVEELESLLGDSGYLRTFAFLYSSKGMCSKALAIWRLLARNYSSGLWKDSVASGECDPVDIPTDLVYGEKAAAMEASKLLQESSDQDLVLGHLGWIAGIDQELAVQILTSAKRIHHLAPDEVLGALDPNKVDIHQRYLQWLIEDQGSDDIQFHTLYALSLAKSTIETNGVNCISMNVNSSVPEMNTIDGGKMCVTGVRQRLQLFLQASDFYDPEEVLDLIGESELWLEKAILYKKMGQETVVLHILALKLEDYEAAEQYCMEIGRDEAYMQLLDIYLNPQDGKPPMFKAAVRLLHNHGESLDPLQVLEKLSPAMPLQLASETILRMLRARVHHHRQGQIVLNLSQAIHVDAQLARLEERSRQVQINEESMCGSCYARLGTKLFAVYPDDSITCYKCYRRRQGESAPVGGRDFVRAASFKQGWLVRR